jgi:ribosomal protein S18 acetylase RimI-like enzyme
MDSDSGSITITQNLEFAPIEISLRNHGALALLKHVKRAEKKAFPANEAFDFDMELTKRNTQLFCVLNRKNRNNPGGGSPEEAGNAVVGYLVIARTGRTALLHKICVLPQYQRKGIGKWMLGKAIEGLKGRGCESVKLWVDQERLAARRLYMGCGFEETDVVEDYYAPGRTGVKMALTF